jgi:CMP-N,N'-diacetyllegionaminic acid synthase
MNNYAIIPARAGSKGLLGKNHRLVNGKPLVAWSIEAALAAPSIDIVVVTSNCPQVKAVFDEYKSQHYDRMDFVWRPEAISGDTSSTEEAMLHALKVMGEMLGDPAWVVLLQPTSPIRSNGLVEDCCKLVMHNSDRYDSLLTCSAHTPFMYHLGEYDIAHPLFHDPKHRPMRQTMRPKSLFYHDCGNVYVMKTAMLLETSCRIGEHPFLKIVDPYQSIQLDTEQDLAIIEAMGQALVPFL